MQPVSAGEWVILSGTAAGTTTVRARSCVLERIVLGTTTTGTVELRDLDTAGTGNSVYTLAGTTSPFQSIELGINFKNGLTAVYGGTVNMTAVIR